MKKLYVDVMTMGGAKHYCQLVYLYNPLFKLDISDVERFVFEKRPCVKYQKDVVLVLEHNKCKNELPQHRHSSLPKQVL